MSGAEIAAMVAAIAALGAVIGSVLCALVLSRRLRELQALVHDLRSETLPALRETRVLADEAATQMLRVSDVLETTEAVSTTVDSASRLAYRAFANPVVKVVAYGSGASGAVRRLGGRRRNGSNPGRDDSPHARRTNGSRS